MTNNMWVRMTSMLQHKLINSDPAVASNKSRAGSQWIVPQATDMKCSLALHHSRSKPGIFLAEVKTIPEYEYLSTTRVIPCCKDVSICSLQQGLRVMFQCISNSMTSGCRLQRLASFPSDLHYTTDALLHRLVLPCCSSNCQSVHQCLFACLEISTTQL